MFSTVFRDMFSIPTTIASPSQTDPIFIDEKAEVLAFVMHMFELHGQTGHVIYPEPPLISLHGALRFYHKFDVQETRKDLEQMMTAQLIGKPYEAFVFASKEDDRDLGKRAIRWMNPTPGFDIWTAISGANPHWQIALIKLLVPLPFPTSSYLEGRWQSKVSFMQEVSATFDPE